MDDGQIWDYPVPADPEQAPAWMTHRDCSYCELPPSIYEYGYCRLAEDWVELDAMVRDSDCECWEEIKYQF